MKTVTKENERLKLLKEGLFQRGARRYFTASYLHIVITAWEINGFLFFTRTEEDGSWDIMVPVSRSAEIKKTWADFDSWIAGNNEYQGGPK